MLALCLGYFPENGFVSSWNGGRMPPPLYRCGVRSRSCPPRRCSHSQLLSQTSFWGKPERRGRWGGPLLRSRYWLSPHPLCQRGSEPLVLHRAIFWPPDPSMPVTTHFHSHQRNWLKEDEWYGNMQFQAVLKSQHWLWPHSHATPTCLATLWSMVLLPPANLRVVIPGCTGPFSKW